MTNTSNKIIFFGTEAFSLAALTGLIEAGYDIAAVVTKPDSKQGRGHRVIAPAVKILAEKHNIPVWQPAKLRDIAQDIKSLQPIAGVLVSYGKIIPQSIIDLFTPGIINVHPSLLPKYRGPSPIESAILNGDTVTGVTIMQLSAAMDAGPLYAAKEHVLQGTETQSELYHALATVGTDLLLETLPKILTDDLQPIDQDDEKASYCQLLSKEDGVIDWSDPATTIERKIRAYKTWPQSRTTLGDIEIIITKAHSVPSVSEKPGTLEVISKEEGIMAVHADNGYLCIDTIKPIGKKEMPIKAFLAGYGSHLN
jgi:methionyl-tRNA formyltransferase